MHVNNLRDAIRPVSDFRKELPAFLKKLRQDRQPIILTQRGRSVAVLIDIDTYERLDYEHRLRSAVAEGVRDADEGRFIPHEKVLKEMRQMLKAKSSR